MEALQALERDIAATEEQLRRLSEAKEILNPHEGELPEPDDNGGDPEGKAPRRFERNGETITGRAREHVLGLEPDSEFTIRDVATAVGVDDATQLYRAASAWEDDGIVQKTRKKAERNAAIYRRTDKALATAS